MASKSFSELLDREPHPLANQYIDTIQDHHLKTASRQRETQNNGTANTTPPTKNTNLDEKVSDPKHRSELLTKGNETKEIMHVTPMKSKMQKKKSRRCTSPNDIKSEAKAGPRDHIKILSNNEVPVEDLKPQKLIHSVNREMKDNQNQNTSKVSTEKIPKPHTLALQSKSSIEKRKRISPLLRKKRSKRELSFYFTNLEKHESKCIEEDLGIDLLYTEISKTEKRIEHLKRISPSKPHKTLSCSPDLGKL